MANFLACAFLPATMAAPPRNFFLAAGLLTGMKTCLGWIMAALVLVLPGGAAQPNVLLILADDLGYADLGAQGCQDVPTPQIDSLARNGVRCTDGYANHPVCAPTRAALMTGRYQHRFGFEFNPGPEAEAAEDFGLPGDVPTLAERLRAAGYATGMVGKWHLGFVEGRRPWERGFESFYGFLAGARSYYPESARANSPLVRNGVEVKDEKAYLTEAFGREAAAFIEGSRDRPWFLYLAFNAVHNPLEATPALEARFAGIAESKRRTYAGMLSAMDDAVGRVLAKVRELGQEENTLILFYSDNGGPTPQTTSRNDPLRGYKGQVYEGGIRVPFLAQWKGTIPAGAVFREPVAGFDCHATALAAAGVKVGPEEVLDGVDLVPFFRGEAEGRPHEALFWRSGARQAIRQGDWKLLVDSGRMELYNLREDIGETEDRAETEPEVRKELAAAWAAWSAQMEPARWQRSEDGGRTPRRTGAAAGGPSAAGSASGRAGSGGAAAGSPGGRLREEFERLDRNGDGRLSREEGDSLRFFRVADADRDGFLTPEEVQEYLRQRRSGEGAGGTEQGPVSSGTGPGVPASPRAAGTPAGAGGGGSASVRAGAQTVPLRDLPTPAPYRAEVAEQRPGEPPRKKMPEADPGRDAAGRGQLFESIVVPGFTDLQEGMNGLAIADLNRDGRLDLVACTSASRLTAGTWGEGENLRVWSNEGGFTFVPQTVQLLEAKVSPERFGRGQVPALADFNGDGFLDLFVTRHAQMSGGRSNPYDQKIGNGLYLSEGAWNVWRDVSAPMGLQNEQAYNRQPALGDVDRDGWLDVAVGCDNIGNAMGGVPHSRLYLFQAAGKRFEDGHYADIGGTERAPDFGGFYHDSARDKAGPDINLIDLDNDGDLDLVQGCHVDVRELNLPYSPIEYRQGIFCWRNLLAETGQARFEKVTGNGLATEARLRLDRETLEVTPVGKAPGLPYLSFADVDNDGRQDVLAVGPASPGWAPRAEYVSGRFWRNRGNFQFEEATETAGFAPLNWTYREWAEFFDFAAPAPRGGRDPAGRRPYFADAIFGDFTNDGWIDVVVLDRHEAANLATRAMLFVNQGGGIFALQKTEMSGLDASGIAGEAADLNGDGLLDLVVLADPENSGGATTMERFESKVYWNTGEGGAKENHWVRLRFGGVSDAALIGARVEAVAAAGGGRQYRWVQAAHSYKSGGALEAHFGLGKADRVEVTVELPDGSKRSFPGLAADRMHTLDLGEVSERAG